MKFYLSGDGTLELSSEGTNWVTKPAEIVTESIMGALEPIGQSITDGLYWLFTSFLAQLPSVFVILGMCMFILSILEGRGRFYGWGLCLWAVSAIFKVIGHNFGIH